MPNPIKPSVVPVWTVGNTGVRVQPTGGEQLAGFVPSFRPPSTWHNWLFGIMSDWVAWLDFATAPAGKTSVQTASTTLAFPIQTFLGNPAGGTFPVAFPGAAANPGYKCSVTNIDSTNNLTITVQTGDYLQGVVNGTVTVGPGESYTFASDGTAGYWQTNN